MRQGAAVIHTLKSAGFEAYYVGGCVRDCLLGAEPKDVDIATSALPEEVEALFEHTVATGKAYGTISVLLGSEVFEVTTFRLESDYDGRRPKVVAFAKDLLTDLARRDFTINAMAMTESGELIDPYGGENDLNHGLLRFVGDAKMRIREDRLRLLRYVRFLCTLGFSEAEPLPSEPEIMSVEGLSAERIRMEFDKILLSAQAERGMRLLERMGLLQRIFPELTSGIGFEQHHPAHFEDVFCHSLRVLAQCEPDLILRLAALGHDLGKVKTLTFDALGVGHFYGHQKESEALMTDFMKRLKYANQEQEAVQCLIRHHMRVYEHISRAAARRLVHQVGEIQLERLFKLQTADSSACAGDRSESLRQIEAMRLACAALLQEERAFSLKDLKVNGFDLMALGYEGRMLGELLNHLLMQVIDEQCENDKTQLLAAARLWQGPSPSAETDAEKDSQVKREVDVGAKI